MALDLVHDELFAANQDSNTVTIYARTANGNVAPLRRISGATTELDSPNGMLLFQP